MKTSHKLTLLALVMGAQTVGAQSLRLADDDTKAPFLLTSKDTVEVNYAAGFNSVAVLSNLDDYTVAPADDADWLTFRKEANGNLTVFGSYYYDNINPRYAALTLSSTDGAFSRTLVVKQTPNTSAEEMGDTQIVVSAASASASESGEGAENMIDGNTATLWHSPYSGGSFPFTLNFTFREAAHLDYLRYTPRMDNNVNGNFGEITVSYATADAPNTFVEAGDADFGMSTGASTFNFGDSGIDNVVKVRIVVRTAASDGGGNYASCAEMGFYEKDQSLAGDMDAYFASPLCAELKSGVTEAQVGEIASPYLRQLARTLLAGGYSTEFRVGEFGCYETRSTLRDRLKTSNGYDPYENPTGIYFGEGDKIVIFAEGISSAHPVQLCIKNFSNADLIGTEGQPESYYSLSNGMNIITAANRGNAYVNYYSDDFANAPAVKLHFAMAKEVGYFDATRNMTNDQWKQILANAQELGADIIDVLTQRMHVAVPLANLRRVCPADGVRLAEIYDAIGLGEREIMGLPHYGIEPKNHQFARPVASGMFADGTGAAAAFGSFDEWCNPNNFGFWGLGHELGHINQITPGFKWSGLGETTNNIYSSWVEHKVGAADAYGTGYHRLEDESSGIGEYSWTRGGRFEAYLEEGVRKGVSWQLQDGPDYNGTDPESITVAGQDENGNSTGQVTTTSRNYDHFLKVIPFWQLRLYTEEAAKSPNAFGALIQTYRDGFDQTKFNTNGKQQIEMMRRFCEVTQTNFLPFFEKAGMLKPIRAYIEDYSPGWNIITQQMCDDLKTEVASKNYKEAPAALNYINAYNWESFRDATPLASATVGQGCEATGDNTIRVDNTVWTGAVGYETYNASDELIRISMFGLGDSERSSHYTYVLFPSSEGASYIMAVAQDGTKVKCYQR